MKIDLLYDKLLANGDVYVYDAAGDKVILNAGPKLQANPIAFNKRGVGMY